MKINVQNMLRQAGHAIPAGNDRGGYKYAMEQLSGHLKQMRDRTMTGDLTAIDEFFRLYVFDEPKDYVRQLDADVTRMRDAYESAHRQALENGALANSLREALKPFALAGGPGAGMKYYNALKALHAGEMDCQDVFKFGAMQALGMDDFMTALRAMGYLKDDKGG